MTEIPDWSMDSYTGYGRGNEPWNETEDEEERKTIERFESVASEMVNNRKVLLERRTRPFDLIQIGLYRMDLEKLLFYLGYKEGFSIESIDDSDIAYAISNLLDDSERWNSLDEIDW